MNSIKEIIDKSKSVVFFGGAGVSTESGIPDFRSKDGLYNQHYKYPHVVLYEENLNENIIEEAIKQISLCDTLIVGGTSLTVYPASGLIRYYNGNKLILIIKDPTPYDKIADLVINDSLGNVFRLL